VKSLYRRGRAFLVALIGLGLVGPVLLAQQGTTAIEGDVTDPQGSAVVSASVKISDDSRSVTRETQTDANGHYQFLSLQPGSYVVHVEATGFRQTVTHKIDALVGTTQRVNIKLELGTVNETVTVTESAAAAINTTDATLGNAFESRQILSLPFEGRDAAGVLSLQPGVAFIPLPKDINPNVDTRNGALNGARGDQTNLTLDGVDNNTQTTGTPFQGAVRSTLDSIEEFRVTTAGDNADQGRSSGGQVALVTKSGTNNFHGSLYEQHRPTNTVANDYFNKLAELSAGLPNKPAIELRNTFGGSLGGPVLKDRLFFFYTYEGQRQSESTQVSRNVPSNTLRDGVVIYPCAPVLDNSGNIITPATQVCPGKPVTGQSGTVYQIPAGRFGVGPTEIKQMDPHCTGLGTCPQGNGPDPAVLATFKGLSAPTANVSDCNNFDGAGFNIACNSFSAPTPLRLNTNIARIDYNLNKSGTHRLFARGNYQTDKQSFAPQYAGLAPNDARRVTSRALAVGYTAVLSNTLVNSFHYGLTRQSQADQGLVTQPQTDIRFFNSVVPATSTTTAFQIPVHNWLDDISWTRGKHSLQFGTNVRLINNLRQSDTTSFNNGLVNPAYLNVSPAGSGGSLDPGAFGFPQVDPNFANVYNDAVVDLVGIVDQVTGNYNRTKTGTVLPQGAFVDRHFRSWEYDWYLQDVWHPKSNLTITAGLRYSILEPPYETNGTQAAPNISLNAFVNQRARLQAIGQTSAPAFSFDLSGQANGKAPYWPWDYKDFGPRLAIAYSPKGNDGIWKALFGGSGKTSIRAGFGIVYDHFGEALVNTFDQNGTFGLSTAISNAASIQTVDGGARYTGFHDIPASSANGVLLTPAPTGGFPASPPASTLGNPVQQISWGLNDNIKTPYSELLDLAVTRELKGGLVFQAAYVGRFAHRLLQQLDLAMPLNITDPKSKMSYFQAAKIFAQDKINGVSVANVQAIPFWENLFPAAAGTNANLCGSSGAPGNASVANPTATQSMYELFYCNSGNGTLGETNAINILDSFCFPACLNQQPGQAPAAPGHPGGPYQFYNPQFSALYAWSSAGSSNYNGAQFSLRSKPTHGVQFDFNYVYSASFDWGSDAERSVIYGGFNSSSIVNTWNPRQNYGPADFDTRHSINFNFIADAPFGKGKRFGSNWNSALDNILGGWQLSGVGRWSSGLPWSAANGAFNFPTNFQLPGDGVLIGAAPKTGVFPGTPAAPSPNVFADGVAAAAAFRLPFVGETGQRNNLRGPGFFTIDTGVNKSFRITERQNLRFSAYAYNVTNSVRFDSQNINNNVADQASFGVFSKTLTTERRMEFALRYQF
jgi:hypothetical protein